MSLLLGALYRGRDLETVRHAWRSRLARLGETRLELRVEAEGLRRAGSGPPARPERVRLSLRPKRGRRVPHRRIGALVRMALGPEREEQAEFWLLEPASAGPGHLRLEGGDWDECLRSVALGEGRQVRLWSPLVCPGGIRDEIESRGWPLGLELRVADCWAVVAVPHPSRNQSFPPPWKGNYGW